MSKIDNPYKSLEASTDYEKFLKKELVQLHDTITSQVKTIKDLDPIAEKREILNDAAKAKVITLKQYKEISEKLKDDPKDFNIVRAIEFAKRKNAKEKEKEGKGDEEQPTRKTVKLKSLPKGLDELLEVSDKPIKLRKTVKLKSDKNINADIDKLLSEVSTIVRKQKKGALTMTQIRSEIFNKLLKEADKQHDNEEITDGEYVLIVRNLNNGNFKTAENLLMGKKQIAEFEKLVKSIPKPIKTKKQKKTKAMLAEEREPHDDEYLMSLPKTKKGLISRSSKEFKALTAEEKERAFSLSELSRTEAKKTKQVEAKAKLSARNKADKQSGQLNIVKTKTLEEAKAEIEAKKKALEEKKKTEASKPSVAKEAEARLKTDLLDFDKAVKRLPEISSISDLSDTVKHRFLNLLSDAYANKKSVSETIKLLRGNKALSEERIIELMDIYDAKENIDLLNKYKNLI